MPTEPAPLSAVLDATAASLSATQLALDPAGEGPQSALALSEATVEMKTTFVRRADGQLGAEPVSLSTATTTNLQSGLVSSVKVQYVAVAGKLPVTPAPVPAPPASVLTAEEVRAMVAKEADTLRLVKAFGTPVVKPFLVPGAGRWLVLVSDASGRVLRERVVVDQKVK